MIALGALSTTALRIGVCKLWSNRSAPQVSIMMLPSAPALARAPQSMEIEKLSPIAVAHLLVVQEAEKPAQALNELLAPEKNARHRVEVWRDR